ncbi:MAG: hypothetical protein AAF135_19265 [Bacteroidota bacterium]
MSHHIQKELSRKQFGLVRYGFWIILGVIIALLATLAYLKIGDDSILSRVMGFYTLRNG